MKAAEWIDRVKKTHGWESDYRVAKELQIRPQTVSNYRVTDRTMDDDISIKVAAALGERPEAVVIDQYAERTKDPALRAALHDAAKSLSLYIMLS